MDNNVMAIIMMIGGHDDDHTIELHVYYIARGG